MGSMHRRAIAALLACALAACGGDEGAAEGSAGAPDVRNALLVTLDTTRADALSLYGFPSPTTANVDALAAAGVTYDRCRAVAPITLPSHASMLTGRYPLRHGVRANGTGRLSREAVTLAERARDGGLETAAFVAAAVLDRRFGLDQGFDVYDQVERRDLEYSTVLASRTGAEVTDAALAWLSSRDPSRRFLLWVHYFDAHAPYTPPERFLPVAGGHPYVAEVAAVDEQVGRLLEALRVSGELARTAVVVVGDHGEDLGEHGEPTHAVYCYDSTLRVPLVVSHPHGERAGERSNEVVSVADVGPTLAEALGLAPLPDADGVSLWSRRVPDDRGVYFESYYGFLFYGWSPIAGWADARAKYVHGPTPEFYDLAADPGELRDLGSAAGERVADYRAHIAALAARPRLDGAALEGAEGADGDEAELLESLAGLGYATGPGAGRRLPEPLEVSDRPAPAERLGELHDLLDARRAEDEGRLEEAVELLGGIVRANPLNTAALDALGACLGRLERWPEALEVLQRLLALDDSQPAVHINLAVAYEATGRPDLALPHIRRGVAIDPRHRLGRISLARILAELGYADEAAEVRASLER